MRVDDVASNILLATSYDAMLTSNTGSKCVLMTWRAVYGRP